MTTLYNGDLPKGIDFGDAVAVDCEMTGLNWNRDKLCLVQLADAKGNCHIVKFDGDDYNAPNLVSLLKSKDVQKIFHFARTDLCFLKQKLGVTVKNVYCTKIASKLCRTYTEKHSLKDLALEILGVELSKEERCSDWSAEHLTEEQLQYAANDVLYLHKIRDDLIEKLERCNRLKLSQACFDFLPSRVKLDLAGFEEVNIFNHH